MGVAFYMAIGVIFLINGVRWVCEVIPTTKTNNLPGFVWVLTAMAVSVVLCYFLKLDQIAKMFALTDIIIPAPWSYVATGVAIGMSSNILYLATQPIRQKYRNKQGKIVTLAKDEIMPLGATEENDYSLCGTDTGANGSTAFRPSGVEPDAGSLPAASTAGAEDTTPSDSSVASGLNHSAPAHWPKAKLVKQLTPLTQHNYYIIPLDDPTNVMEVDRGQQERYQDQA